MADDFSDNDIYHCDDCIHWLHNDSRKGKTKNKCKANVIMPPQRIMVRINNMLICKSFKFGEEYG